MVDIQLGGRNGNARKGVIYLAASFPICIGLMVIYRAIMHDSSLAVIGVFLISLGILLCTIREGIMIAPEENWYKYYFSILSLKLGMKENMDSYKDILCLRYKTKLNFYDRHRGNREVEGEVRHEIYLASPNHLNMILIKTAGSPADAKEKVHKLVRKLGMEWVQYNPGGSRPRKVLGGMKTSDK